MHYSYTLTESDAIKAMRFHAKAGKSNALIFLIIAAVLFFLGLFVKYEIIIIAAAIGIPVGYFFNFYLVIPYRVKKQFKQLRGLRNEITMQLSDQGINFKGETGESNLLWSDIQKWKYGNGIYLLFVTNYIFHIVPKSALSGSDKLSELLNQHLGSKKHSNEMPWHT